jgi:hypothetical protein
LLARLSDNVKSICRLGFGIYKLEEVRTNMTLIKKSTLCAVIFLCSNAAFASNVNNHTTNLTHTTTDKPQSIMTVASADFSFTTIEEHDGRLVSYGRRGGLNARRVSLRR